MPSTLSEFTCALNGKPSMANVNEIRYCRVVEVCGSNEDESLRQSKNFNTSSVPPSQGCLNEHSKRANFQAAIWKTAHYPPTKCTGIRICVFFYSYTRCTLGCTSFQCKSDGVFSVSNSKQYRNVRFRNIRLICTIQYIIIWLGSTD